MTRVIKGLALVGLVSALTVLTANVTAQVSKATKSTTENSEKKVELGEKVPDFELADLDGKTHKLSDYKDKYLVIEWTNPDCPWVQKTYEAGIVADTIKKLKEMGEDYEYIAINSTAKNTTKEDVIKREKAFLKQHDLDFTVLIDFDGKVGKMFDAKHTPDLFVLDKEQKLRYFGGYTDDTSFKKGTDATNYPINALTQLKKGETVSPDTARRWGCSVKYAD